jgi:CheY-like chemotaxis protein
VADDNEGQQKLLKAILSSLDVSVEIASDGAAAAAAAEAQRFDLILMDIAMPKLNGLAAARLIRAHETKAGWPRSNIIVLTSHDNKADRARALEAGADTYLTKPLSVAELLGALESRFFDFV